MAQRRRSDIQQAARDGDLILRNVSTEQPRAYIVHHYHDVNILSKFTARLVRSQQIPTGLSYSCGCFGEPLCLENGGALSDS